MRIAEMHWKQVEDWLNRDNRCVLPVGSTEQHAGLSLCVDNILAERVAADAAGPTGVPVFPPVNYGLTPYFMAYPGTVTLQTETYVALLCEILGSLADTGFRRILIVNGHGGNAHASDKVSSWASARAGLQIIWHDWWKAPATWAAVQEVDSQGCARILDGELPLDKAGRRDPARMPKSRWLMQRSTNDLAPQRGPGPAR